MNYLQPNRDLNSGSATREMTPRLPALLVDVTDSLRQRDFATRLGTEITLLAGGTLLLVLLCLARIQTGLIPVTGQTLGVLLVGAALGWKRGAICVGCYLLLGLTGAPVFTTGVGAAAFAGPAGGFLLSFVPAAALVGMLSERGWDRNIGWALLAFLAGHILIFAMGVSWLSVWLQDLDKALTVGLLPFIPGMLIKTAIATALLPIAWKLRRSIG